MILTDQQIERYSRQIIVPGVGGRAQERLLGAHAALIAEAADAEAAASYLAGAGVGRITIHPVDARAPYARIVEHLRDLNPDVAAVLADGPSPAGGAGGAGALPPRGLILALIGSVRTAEVAASVCRGHGDAPAVVARLDAPALIALLPAPPPCALCADAALWAASGARGANAGAVAMVAVAEAFKLLAGFEQRPEARLFAFAGYAAAPRILGRRAGVVRCGCEAR